MNTNTILTGDCLAILPTLPAGSVNLVLMDPPYNIGLGYGGYDDRRPRADYLGWLEDVFRQTIRVLSPSGSLWVQCGQSMQAEACVMLKRLGLHFRNSVIWHYTFGPNQRRKFSPCWQVLHYFTPHRQRFTFNTDAVRVPSDRQTKYGDKRANPKGKVPSDVWKVPRVCGTFHERIKDHPCQTPLAVVERIIKACSNPGDVVLDPMAGTGSTCVAAARLGRQFIGIEEYQQTAEMARGRIDKMLTADAS